MMHYECSVKPDDGLKAIHLVFQIQVSGQDISRSCVFLCRFDDRRNCLNLARKTSLPEVLIVCETDMFF